MDQRSNNFWEATYRQNIAKMIGICCRYTQNRQTAEDLAHDAFMVAIDKVSSFENKGPFEAWLRRIAVNVALQYLRERKKQEQFGQIVPYSVGDDNVQEEYADPGNYTFSETELLEVISYLPEHHRLVFNLYVLDHFTHAQIAAQLGISEGTSKSHLARARKKIRELLHEQLYKNKERKRGMLFLLFPYKLWNVDRLFAQTLNGFSIQPHEQLLLDQFKLDEVPIPGCNNAFIANKIYLKTGFWVIGTALVSVGISHWHLNSDHHKTDLITSNSANPMLDRGSRFITEDVNTNRFLFSDSMAATISDNPIIVEKTKNSGPMKNLSTLGGLLMAGLAFDSSALMKELPVQFIDQQLASIVCRNRRWRWSVLGRIPHAIPNYCLVHFMPLNYYGQMRNTNYFCLVTRSGLI